MYQMKKFLDYLFCKHENIEFIKNIDGFSETSLTYKSKWTCKNCGATIYHSEPIYPEGTKVFLVYNSGLMMCERKLIKICRNREIAQRLIEERNNPNDWIEDLEVCNNERRSLFSKKMDQTTNIIDTNGPSRMG